MAVCSFLSQPWRPQPPPLWKLNFGYECRHTRAFMRPFALELRFFFMIINIKSGPHCLAAWFYREDLIQVIAT